MKVVSDISACSLTESTSKQELTLSKVKAYNKVSEQNLARALSLYDEKKAKIHNLLLRNLEAKEVNQSLRKRILLCNLKKNRILLLMQQNAKID
jgi:hypothetical protein